MSDPQNDTNLAASANPADERRAQLAALIPEAFTEGKLDVAALKRALGEAAVLESGERYALTYFGKVKLIYIDPPYNTGSDNFIYPDRFQESKEEFGQELTTPVEALTVAGSKVFTIHERKMLFVLESFNDEMIDPLVDMRPRELVVTDGVFKDSDMLKSNLDLQCRDAGIKFTCL